MTLENSVTVICFYTRNTPYEQEVVSLKTSATRFAIPIEVVSFPSQGSWEANVAMKAPFILSMLKKKKGPVLWVDADAAFLQKPDFSLFTGVDFSVRFMQIFQDRPEHAINAATIFINQTKEAHELVEKWVDRCEALKVNGLSPPFVDQIALYEVLKENKEAKVLPLPVSYCKIYDIDSFFLDDDQVVIEQRQLSRTTKPLQSNP